MRLTTRTTLLLLLALTPAPCRPPAEESTHTPAAPPPALSSTTDAPSPDSLRRALGYFTPAQRRVVALTADFLSRFFSLPVRVLPDPTPDDVPASARRVKSERADGPTVEELIRLKNRGEY